MRPNELDAQPFVAEQTEAWIRLTKFEFWHLKSDMHQIAINALTCVSLRLGLYLRADLTRRSYPYKKAEVRA